MYVYMCVFTYVCICVCVCMYVCSFFFAFAKKIHLRIPGIDLLPGYVRLRYTIYNIIYPIQTKNSAFFCSQVPNGNRR
uniref:Putative secreted protein n=1 Tax=Xenopsylla cheopis TaxID=163159 RepID=A0A6M2DVA9_XENCH